MTKKNFHLHFKFGQIQNPYAIVDDSIKGQ